jgi:hypothetical protein
MTGEDGTAPFWIERPGKYVIETTLPGFKKRRIKNVMVGAAGTQLTGARVQVRLTLSGPFVTVY